MSNTIIKTIDLTHTYKTGVTALKSVNAEIYENEIVSIIGQNGSGKTTLVRHFNGLLRPTSGSVLVRGDETKNKSVAEMSKMVGYVFQNPNHQIFSTTVLEELSVAPINFKFSPKERQDAIDRVVELMDLKDVLDTHPLTLDYTTKKIVTIASVLAFRPEILIMDEPTGGLDENGRRMLTKIIQMMKNEGHTVVIISHDMDYVAENSERIIVMANASIISEGNAEKIFTDKEILKTAQIEPPQITQLDLELDNKRSNIALSVDTFVEKYNKILF